MSFHPKYLLIVIIMYMNTTKAVSQNSTFKNLGGFSVYGGVGYSKYSVASTTDFKLPVFLPSFGICGRFFASDKLALQATIEYLSVGSRNVNNVSTEILRNQTIQLGTISQYFLSSYQSKLVTSVKGGLFGGRIIDSWFYYHDYADNINGRNRPVGTFGKWNYGFVVGADITRVLNNNRSISMEVQSDIGICNINSSYLPKNTRTLTRAYRLSFSYNF